MNKTEVQMEKDKHILLWEIVVAEIENEFQLADIVGRYMFERVRGHCSSPHGYIQAVGMQALWPDIYDLIKEHEDLILRRVRYYELFS